MLTYHRHRYLTRWPRRAAFALAILLLLALNYRAWKRTKPQAPEQRGQQV